MVVPVLRHRRERPVPPHGNITREAGGLRQHTLTFGPGRHAEPLPWTGASHRQEEREEETRGI